MARLIELVRRRRTVAAVIACGVLGLVAGLGMPVPVKDSLNATESHWSLPGTEEVVRYDEARFAALRQSARWSGRANVAGGSGQGAAASPTWRLVGVVFNPAPMALVTTEGATAMARLRIGQQTPDGGTITAMSRSEIRYTMGGCDYTRRLHSPAPTASACDAP